MKNSQHWFYFYNFSTDSRKFNHQTALSAEKLQPDTLLHGQFKVKNCLALEDNIWTENLNRSIARRWIRFITKTLNSVVCWRNARYGPTCWLWAHKTSVKIRSSIPFISTTACLSICLYCWFSVMRDHCSSRLLALIEMPFQHWHKFMVAQD